MAHITTTGFLVVKGLRSEYAVKYCEIASFGKNPTGVEVFLRNSSNPILLEGVDFIEIRNLLIERGDLPERADDSILDNNLIH